LHFIAVRAFSELSVERWAAQTTIVWCEKRSHHKRIAIEWEAIL
jgi:hypothetical protein